MNDINEILNIAITKGASDIHLTKNLRPSIRLNGILTPLDFEVETDRSLENYLPFFGIINEKRDLFLKEKCFDSSFSFGGIRFRVHIYRQMNACAFALRLIPSKIPSFTDMNLPLSLRNFTKMENGLVLITGTTGSGKSTSLAAIIDEINTYQNKHIITVENPVEFVHSHKQSIVNQREVGTDVSSFHEAVRDAMREDPDILLLGELRDLETISNAITMAETGHLVFGTLHTKSVAETFDRIIDVFPAEQQEQIRVQLANSIKGVISQTLLPKIGGGRVARCEIMFANNAIKNSIRKAASPSVYEDTIKASAKKDGGQTKIMALAKLVNENLITKDVAINCLDDDSEIKELMSSIVAN